MGNDMVDVNKVTTDVITELTKTVVKGIIGKVKDRYKDFQSKEEIDLLYAFEEYLRYSEGNNSKVKTLLYKHVPKDLYSFYECIGITNGSLDIDTSDVNNVLKLGHRVIISGTGGMGKSILLKHLFLNTIENTKLVPILVELRGLNNLNDKEVNITNFVYQNLRNLRCNIKEEYFNYSLETGCYLILFDGYDEVQKNISNKVAKEILALATTYPDNYYIVSSRPLHEFIGWDNFSEYSTKPMTKEQALSLINKLDYDNSIKSKFYKELKENYFDKYQSFASNPLLLTIMLMTFEARASIPDKLNDFYEQAFTTLFHTHDATKGGYRRDISSELGYEDFRAVFAYFCFKSFFENNYTFSRSKVIEYINKAVDKKIISSNFDTEKYLIDLTDAVCMLVIDGLEYRFVHRSFQEYFAALYTTQLPDDVQIKLLDSWLKERRGYLSSNYLYMLYDLQQSRFERNVIHQGYQHLKREMANNMRGTDIDSFIFGRIFNGMSIPSKSEEGLGRITIRANDMYLADLIWMTCDIYGYKHNPSDIQMENELELIEILRKECDKSGDEDDDQPACYMDFETLKEKNLYSEAKTILWWARERFDFALNQMEKIELSNVSRKKKFESIFDEL